MDYIADTSLLVGLWRRQGWALDFAKKNAKKSLGLPWVVLGEFWHGATRAGHDPSLVQSFLEIGIPILDARDAIAVFARVCADLQTAGCYGSIGANDLWIAAVAISNGKPLVSRNKRHFGRIEGLELVVLESA